MPLMLNSYVRCPADLESVAYPRVFVCGRLTAIDRDKGIAIVHIYDPFATQSFFEDLPTGKIEFPLRSIQSCQLFKNSRVIYNMQNYIILSVVKQDDYFWYYIQNEHTKEVVRKCETEIIAAYDNGKVDPVSMLANYEFQNPCWYFGRSIVAQNMRILENSLLGFKELAGSKIYLMPHQINTIMRCLKEEPCRYMLADEVGMGKTIEAISIVKLFMENRHDKHILIVTPESLREQWRTELLFKFNLSEDDISNGNRIKIISAESLMTFLKKKTNKWDFVVVDEIHKYLSNDLVYKCIHKLSSDTENILLLSATPVQERKEEYLALLRLLHPSRYDLFTVEQFSNLIAKQSSIIEKSALALNDLTDYEEVIREANKSGDSPAELEDCEELFEEITERLKSICNEIKDPELDSIYDKIKFDSEDLGVYAIRVALSMICSNYQIENNIIRNRRRLLESDESRVMATREVIELAYDLDSDKNTQEKKTYEALTNWIIEKTKEDPIFAQNHIKPIASAFFSSPWAFLNQWSKEKSSEESWNIVNDYAIAWKQFEDGLVDHISDVLDDPDGYEEEYSTRIAKVLDWVREDAIDQKVVLFTNYAETYHAYRKALLMLFASEELSFFCKGMDPEEQELNIFRFESSCDCKILLCDATGGEGRNLQCADAIVHIDLPWDAGAIEQRIGRLDRLERNPDRNVVTSVVAYAANSFESSLFRFWSEGLNVFKQSLSGMEIIMGDVNQMILASIQKDFRYGLEEDIPNIVELSQKMRKAVHREQNYDAASTLYRPMYIELKNLIDFYSQNETQLFAETMSEWASLAGFHGYSWENELTYTAGSFSIASARNALFVPPQWEAYSNSKKQRVIENMYRPNSNTRRPERAIKGTFVRKNAIENDYLHFFAPGDEIFDRIIDNALCSCKGQASSYAIRATHNWKGFVFVFYLTPNENELYEKGISPMMIGEYRSFLMNRQVIVPISLDNPEDLSDSEIVSLYTEQIKAGLHKPQTCHLGSRHREATILKDVLEPGMSNIKWFRRELPAEIWREQLKNARDEAIVKAKKIISKKSNWKGAEEEMNRSCSAREANAAYYGLTADGIELYKQRQQDILKALKSSKITVDSAAFVWMIKEEE